MNTFYIDLKYAKLLGGRLTNFKQTKNNTFTFAHTCEQGTGKLKSRGNFYPKGDMLMFHCYHCSQQSSFGKFLRLEDPTLHAEYRLEAYRGGIGVEQKPLFGVEKIEVQEQKESVSADLDQIIPVLELPKNSSVLEYLRGRNIPDARLSELGVVADFYPFASKYDSTFEKFKRKHPRLLLPYFRKDGQVFAYSCRSFGNEKPKYINLVLDAQVPRIYGTWLIDESRDIFAVEGQFDSMFIDNAIAVGSASYSSDYILSRKDKIIIVPDNDWKRNPQVFKSLYNSVESGFRISLLPESIPWKDINDCVSKGKMDSDHITDVLKDNVFHGAQAKLELNFRKKF